MSLLEQSRKKSQEKITRLRARGEIKKVQGILIPKTQQAQRVLSQAKGIQTSILKRQKQIRPEEKIKTTTIVNEVETKTPKGFDPTKAKILPEGVKKFLKESELKKLGAKIIKEKGRTLTIIREKALQEAEKKAKQRNEQLKKIDPKLREAFFKISKEETKFRKRQEQLQNFFKKGLDKNANILFKNNSERKIVKKVNNFVSSLLTGTITFLPEAVQGVNKTALLLIIQNKYPEFRKDVEGQFKEARKTGKQEMREALKRPETYLLPLIPAFAKVIKPYVRTAKIKPKTKTPKTKIKAQPKKVTSKSKTTKLAKELIKVETNRVLKQLRKDFKVFKDQLTITKTTKQGLRALKKEITKIKNKVVKIKTRKDLLTTSLKARRIQKKFNKQLKKQQKKKVKKRKIKVRKAKIKRTIQQTLIVKKGKRTFRFTKQKLNILKAKSLNKLENLQFRLKEALKITKRKIDKEFLKLEIRKVNAVIKYKTKYLDLKQDLTRIINNRNNLVKIRIKQLKNKFKKLADNKIKSRAELEIRKIISNTRRFLIRIEATFKRAKTTKDILKLVLQIKKQQIKNNIKRLVKPIKKTVSSKKRLIKRVSKKVKTSAKITRQAIKQRTATELRKVTTPIKTKASKVKRKITLTSRRAKKTTRITKEAIKIRLQKPILALKSNIRKRLVIALNNRGIQLRRRTKKTQQKLKVFTKESKAIGLSISKNNRNFEVLISEKGLVNVYESVTIPSKTGLIQTKLLKLNSFKPTSTKSIVNNPNKYSSTISKFVFTSINKKPKTLTPIKIKISPKIKTIPKRKTIDKRKSITEQRIDTKRKTTQKPKTKTKQKITIKSKQAIKQRQTQLRKQLTNFKIPPRLRIKLRRLIPPKFKKQRKLTKKEQEEFIKWLKKQKPEFRPSLVAILFNITSTVIPKRITGLEIRPIIVRKKVSNSKVRKKRKAKKTKK